MHLSGRSEKPVISHERAFLSSILLRQILAVWWKAVADSFDRAPAGGFLVRRPQVFSAGSKGRAVKARAAARRGSLDRLPAFGIFAGVTDGEAGDSGYLHQERFVLYTEKFFTFPMVS